MAGYHYLYNFFKNRFFETYLSNCWSCMMQWRKCLIENENARVNIGLLPSVNSILWKVLRFKLRPKPKPVWFLSPCPELLCGISLLHIIRYVNLNKPLHLLGISWLTYNIDALEMSSCNIGIGIEHLRDCLIIADLFLW